MNRHSSRNCARSEERCRRLTFRWVLLALCLICLGRAEAQSNARPAALTDVTATDVSPDRADIVLTFTPIAPNYSVIANDTTHPSIAFALSSRNPTARVPADLKGLVHSVDFEQSQTVLIIHFGTAVPARIDVSPPGGTTLGLSISRSVPSAGTPSNAAQSPALAAFPTHTEKDGASSFVVVPLKYADVSEVVGLLTEGLTVAPNDSFTPIEPAFGSSSLGGSGPSYTPAPASVTPTENQPMAQSVDDVIAIDRRLNAIILKGPPQLIAHLKAEIAKIDVPVRSVILETIFVELTQTGAKNLGLDFNNANGQIGVATFQTGAFVPAGIPYDKKLTSTSLQAALYAEVQAGQARIVSKPRIAAQSGGTAKIITGDAIPILTAITLSGVNGVSQQVQYVNVGVSLQIAPRVTSDGFVTSHIFGEVSSVTGYLQGYPTISQREAETSATVRDGETFVIGGLTEKNDISVKSHVPLLGRLPIAGQLFSLEKGSNSKTELYIVVTPHITQPQDAAQLKLPPEDGP